MQNGLLGVGQGRSYRGPGQAGRGLSQGSDGDGEKRMVPRLPVSRIGQPDVVMSAQVWGWTASPWICASDLPLESSQHKM